MQNGKMLNWKLQKWKMQTWKMQSWNMQKNEDVSQDLKGRPNRCEACRRSKFSVISLHWPGSSMALFNDTATILFSPYVQWYIMVVALALPLASCLWQWLCHLPLLVWYIRGFVSNHVSGNGSVICLHWPDSYMAFLMLLQQFCFLFICIDISWLWLCLCHLPHVCGNGSATCLRWPGTSVAF